MLYLILLVPFITCIFLAFRSKDDMPIKCFIIIGVSFLITLISWLFGKYAGVTDVEYLGHHAVKIQYNEEWDEWITEICTRTVHDGYDKDGHEITHTETYDCSHREYHGPTWYMWDENDGDTWWPHSISKETYDKILKRFGTKEKFINMHRNYYRIDGDRYEAYFDGHRNHVWSFAEMHTYKNKILKSKSIFNFSEVNKKDLEDNTLYDYPKYKSFYDQNPIIGYKCPESVVDSFKYVNGVYGPLYQFRCYVMIWRNEDLQISTLERDYLIGGNKNEVIVCMSIDDNDNIQWVNAFSWEDSPEIAIGVNYIYEQGEHLDLMKLNRYLIDNVPDKWHRKEFVDFEYINNEIPTSFWVVVLIIILIFNAGAIIADANMSNKNIHRYDRNRFI